MGRLVLVPTPLGNLGDITLRAIEVLKSSDFILAEDTRTTGVLLKRYEIDKPVRPFHLHNEHKVLHAIVSAIEKADKVSLVSDAGTPGISDPGFLLVRACIAKDIEVECLPGPTAIIPALVISGFPSDRFCFEGFLPHKKGRQTRIKRIVEEDRTVIIYESPFRLLKLLQELKDWAGPDRPAAVVREISKIHEEVKRGSIEDLIKHFQEKGIKGEIVVVLGGKSDQEFSSEGFTKRNKA